ncbi:MAG TPA: family 43 glycosylhydrolase, partial [Segetibacter sp.]|nr:family 43 glycosylhydrolase [Segetibacter sp.]
MLKKFPHLILTKPMKIYYLPFLLVCCFFLARGKTSETFHSITNQQDTIKKQPEYFEWEKISKDNAVIPGDFADPSIIRVGDTYYATGTSSEWAPHFPIFTSKNLATWQQIGYVLNQTPSWAASSFWAPELFYLNETFYVYYVAKKK